MKFFKETIRTIGALLSLVRGIILLCMLAFGAMTIYLIVITARITVNQYNETLTWQNTSYDVPRAEIEPALVSNVVDIDTADAVSALNALDVYVESLDGSSAPDMEIARQLISDARHWQEKYGLESDAITRLSLYVDLENAITEAYETLDTSKLEELGLTLYNLELEKTTSEGQMYMEKLRNVSSDFSDVKQLMTETVWSVGTIEDGVWTIPYTFTRTDLSDALEQMKTMEKFPAVGDTEKVLSDISTVLNYNKNAKEYFEYQEFKEIAAMLKRSEYVPVSSIYTYEQALAFGCEVQCDQIPGYTISLKSIVSGIYYNGERLDNSDYVRIGAPLVAELDESYEAVPVIPEIQPEQIIMEGDINYGQGN